MEVVVEVTQKHYVVNGVKYERYSTVADMFPHPSLIEWKVDQSKKCVRYEFAKKAWKEGDEELDVVLSPYQISQRALKVGGIVDGYCLDDWQKGGYKIKKSDPEEVSDCMKAWENWKKDYPEVYGDIQEMQRLVKYEDWGCAGTLDIRTSQGIIDIKTSRRVSDDYWVQTAFYNREFQLPEKWVLQLGKGNGDYLFQKCPEKYSQEYLENVFVGMLVRYRFVMSSSNDEEQL